VNVYEDVLEVKVGLPVVGRDRRDLTVLLREDLTIVDLFMGLSISVAISWIQRPDCVLVFAA